MMMIAFLDNSSLVQKKFHNLQKDILTTQSLYVQISKIYFLQTPNLFCIVGATLFGTILQKILGIISLFGNNVYVQIQWTYMARPRVGITKCALILTSLTFCIDIEISILLQVIHTISQYLQIFRSHIGNTDKVMELVKKNRVNFVAEILISVFRFPEFNALRQKYVVLF